MPRCKTGTYFNKFLDLLGGAKYEIGGTQIANANLLDGNLKGTTVSIGGTALTAGSCATGTASITGATTSMVAMASPVIDPGAAFTYKANVISVGTVIVYVCTNLAGGGTPKASAYNVRVIQ